MLIWRAFAFLCCRKDPDLGPNDPKQKEQKLARQGKQEFEGTFMTEAKDWAGELISGQTTTGRILVSYLLNIDQGPVWPYLNTNEHIFFYYNPVHGLVLGRDATTTMRASEHSGSVCLLLGCVIIGQRFLVTFGYVSTIPLSGLRSNLFTPSSLSQSATRIPELL